MSTGLDDRDGGSFAEQTGGRLWFQLYVWKRRYLSYQVIERAKKAGYEALVVTVDFAVRPNREYNAHNGFSAATQAQFSHGPRWTSPSLLAGARREGPLP